MKFSDIKLPSNKKFGFLFFGIFLLVGIYAFYANKAWLLIFSSCILIFILAALFFNTSLLQPFNKAWMFFGYCIGRVISPIILGLIYFLIISPIGIILKIFNRDELDIKKYNKGSSWKNKSTSFSLDSFKNQF